VNSLTNLTKGQATQPLVLLAMVELPTLYSPHSAKQRTSMILLVDPAQERVKLHTLPALVAQVGVLGNLELALVKIVNNLWRRVSSTWELETLMLWKSTLRKKMSWS